MPKIRTAVLISGRGSNMEALINAARAKDYPASVELVISNRPGAAGLNKAQEHGVKAICIDHENYDSREAFEKVMQRKLDAAQIDLICCAGFMRILTQTFTQQWSGRLINIHPSLLPKYKGLQTHERVLEAGDEQHGCTVHYVTAELDSGDIIMQSTINVMPSDRPTSLAAKVNEKELSLYPKALEHVSKALLEGL